MSGIRHETLVRILCIRCISVMVDIQVTQCEEFQCIRDMMELRKCFSELAQAGESCDSRGVQVRLSLGRNNVQNRLENVSLSNNLSFSNDSQLAPTSAFGKVYNENWVEPLYNLQL